MFEKIKNKFFHKYDKRNFIKRLFGYCDCPCHKRHWFVYPTTIRCNTRYQDESSNYITCCEDFYTNDVAPQIEDMWHEYYSSRF